MGRVEHECAFQLPRRRRGDRRPETSSLAARREIPLSVTDGFGIGTIHLGDFDPGDFSIRELVTKIHGRMINGWQLNAILVWQSGFPFTVSSGRDNSFSAVGSDRADYLGGPAALSSDRPRGEQILEWFDTSQFTANAIGTFGNSGRNILRGPKYLNTDFGIPRNFNFTERVRLGFRAKFFNLFNNVNFRQPNSNASSSQFGRITQVVNDSQRIAQLGVKLEF